MTVYRITKEDNVLGVKDKILDKIKDIFTNDKDALIILEKDIHIRDDNYYVKLCSVTGEKFVTLGRRERNRLCKRQRVNVGLLHIIDRRVNYIGILLNLVFGLNISIWFFHIFQETNHPYDTF